MYFNLFFDDMETDVTTMFTDLKAANIAHINFIEVKTDEENINYIYLRVSFFGESYVRSKIQTELNTLGYTGTFTLVQIN